MSWTLIAHGVGTSTVTLNTTGADLIVIGTSGGSSGMSDNQGNTYTQIDTNNVSGRQVGITYFVHNPTTAASCTFTTGQFAASFEVQVWSGSGTGTVLDQHTTLVTNGNGSLTTAQTGSITPTTNGQLIVAFWALDDPADTSDTVDSSMTISDHFYTVVGATFGSIMSYLAPQTTAAAINPTLTRSGGGAPPTGRGTVGMIASFKGAAAAGDTLQGGVPLLMM